MEITHTDAPGSNGGNCIYERTLYVEPDADRLNLAVRAVDIDHPRGRGVHGAGIGLDRASVERLHAELGDWLRNS